MAVEQLLMNELDSLSCSFGPSHGPNQAGNPGMSATAAARDANSQLYESVLFHTYKPACAAVTPKCPPSHTMAVLVT